MTDDMTDTLIFVQSEIYVLCVVMLFSTGLFIKYWEIRICSTVNEIIAAHITRHTVAKFVQQGLRE